MQTFLPYADFSESARVLDTKRLGKQRVEVLQILNALLNPDAKGWKNHPATVQWKGFEGALAAYGVAVCDEWIARGFNDTCREKILNLAKIEGYTTPPWLGREDIHSSHRSRLLAKDFEHYSKWGWNDDPTLGYIWPSKENQ